MLCPLARHFIRCLVLVQPRKTENRPDMTEKLLTGTTNKQTYYGIAIMTLGKVGVGLYDLFFYIYRVVPSCYFNGV